MLTYRHRWAYLPTWTTFGRVWMRPYALAKGRSATVRIGCNCHGSRWRLWKRSVRETLEDWVSVLPMLGARV